MPSKNRPTLNFNLFRPRFLKPTMGKSAKVHKRVSKKMKSNTTSSSTVVTTLNATSSSVRPQVQAAKKRASLKEKTAKEKGPGKSKSNGVLGGADYVTLLMGGRRKADEEAKKLPQGDS
ncbi:hypothetical protein BYT27DRAFT_7202655 [Phlegmacium glaucopus]|nr:hypothetical protein BYT27DRAFT_7202655 [Phlegmacium glaucopus]